MGWHKPKIFFDAEEFERISMEITAEPIVAEIGTVALAALLLVISVIWILDKTDAIQIPNIPFM